MAADKPTHGFIVDYMQNLNSQLKDFPDNSFFRMDIDEIFDGFRAGINFPAMSIESPEGDTKGSQVSASVISRTFAFTILQNPEKTNYAEQNQMLDQCERIGLKILSRLRYDNTQMNNVLHQKVDLTGFSWVKVGPIFDEELYGYRFTVHLTGNESLKLDPDDWKDIDSIC